MIPIHYSMFEARLLVVNFSKRAIFFKNSTIFSRDMKCISYTIEDNAFSSKHTNCLLFLKSNRKKSFSLEQISSSDIWSPFSGGIIWRTRSSHVNFPPLKSTGYWGRGGGAGHGETLQAWYIWLGFDIYLKKSNLHEAISSIA